MDRSVPEEILPYPLPPWEHDFRALADYAEVDEATLQGLVPAPMELRGNFVQISVMYFDSTVPVEPYYDAAVIAPVSFEGVDGGYWVHGYTSTDTVLSGTREIWGYKMKRADGFGLEQNGDRYTGFTERRGKRVISVEMNGSGTDFTPPNLFPRLFFKLIPHADRGEADVKRIVVMRAETTRLDVDITGEGSVALEPSAADPLHEVSPVKVIGASYAAGHQILPWAEEIT